MAVTYVLTGSPGANGISRVARPAKRRREGSQVLLSQSDGEAEEASLPAASESGSDFSLGNCKVPGASKLPVTRHFEGCSRQNTRA